MTSSSRRQDHHGQLTGAARSVPRQRCLRRRPNDLTSVGRPRHYEVRARCPGADRPEHDQPEEAGLPVPLRHWLAGEELHDWAKTTIQESQTDHIFNKAEVLAMLEEHPVSFSSGSVSAPAPTTAPPVDRARLHDLARHLRRGPDPPGDRRATSQSTQSTGAWHLTTPIDTREAQRSGDRRSVAVVLTAASPVCRRGIPTVPYG